MRCLPIIPLFVMQILASSVTLRAQQYLRDESEATMIGGNHEIILTPDKGYITVIYPDGFTDYPFVITRFDPKLNQLYTSTLNELSGQRFLSVLYSDDRLFLLCEDKKHAVIRYEIDDKTGKLTGSPMNLYSLEGKEPFPHLYSGASENRAYHYFMFENQKKERGKSLEGVITDKKMNIVSTFSYLTPEKSLDMNFEQAVLFNSGALILCYKAYPKKYFDGFIPWIHNLVLIKGQDKPMTGTLSGLPDGQFDLVTWRPQDDKLAFTGMLRRAHKYGFTDVISGMFDPSTGKTSEIHESELANAPGVESSSESYMKRIVEKGIDDMLFPKIDSVVICRDGSRLLIIQSISGGYNHSGSYERVSNSNFLIKLDTHNNILWVRGIAQFQIEGERSHHLGSIYALDDQDGVHAFFYDNKKNTKIEPEQNTIGVSAGDPAGNSFASVYIDRNGNMKKQFLESGVADFYPLTDRGRRLQSNEIVYISYKSKRPLGYRLGRIRIKM